MTSFEAQIAKTTILVPRASFFLSFFLFFIIYFILLFIHLFIFLVVTQCYCTVPYLFQIIFTGLQPAVTKYRALQFVFRFIYYIDYTAT